SRPVSKWSDRDGCQPPGLPGPPTDRPDRRNRRGRARRAFIRLAEPGPGAADGGWLGLIMRQRNRVVVEEARQGGTGSPGPGAESDDFVRSHLYRGPVGDLFAALWNLSACRDLRGETCAEPDPPRPQLARAPRSGSHCRALKPAAW